jgi:Domain of unknown function (DUF4136)
MLSITCGFAQKVKVGYDKSVDFSKYKSYTWQEPGTESRPFLYATVAGSIRSELEAKGLARMEKDGDLTVITSGGIGYGLSGAGVTADSCQNCQKPLADPMEWTGKTAPPGISGAPLPEGTLELELVDRASNKVVWSGMVTQKFNPEKQKQALERAGNAIKKLLMEFPPKK